MSTEIQEKNVSVKISVKSLEILDRLAKQADISRHKLIHDILELTIDELDFGRKIGFFQMVILIRNFAQKFNLLADESKAEREEKTIPIRLSSNYYDMLDVLAKKADRSRHYLMNKFIEIGADELDKIHNKKVIVTHGILMRKLKLNLNTLCNEGEKAFDASLSENKL
jgi:predicted DNA-binding protein